MSDELRKLNKSLNRDQKRARTAADIHTFIGQYGRRARKGLDPNDRTYSRDMEQRIKNLDPLELDRLMREDEE
jgi:hypothetical protein